MSANRPGGTTGGTRRGTVPSLPPAARTVVRRPSIVETALVPFPTDPGVIAAMKTFGVTADDILGHGGEAWVYALGDDRVVRILQPGGRAADMVRRQRLVSELNRGGALFALPHILEIGEVAGRAFSVERRLPGRSVLDELRSSAGSARKHLVERHLDAAAALGDLSLEPRRTYGDLIAEDQLTTSTWRRYLVERAAANLSRSGRQFRSVDPEELADGLPEPTRPSFVHLDAYVGNMLTDGTNVTAVIDIGSTSVAGDRRLDPLSAAVYLTAPEITPVATASDVDVAASWLRAAGLHHWFEPARRWLAAFWSAAVDDPTLFGWCRGVLLEGH
jgi:aminoglycoside phosphotransferase (APT) family kinase protein